MSTSLLFREGTLGDLSIQNRIVMAPLTRMRADNAGIPSELAATYYSQRASAGLIVAEATQICPLGRGYPCTPGIHTVDQIAAWKKVTDAVHAHGSKIVLQLWHVGRISHSSLHPDEGLPVAPSAIKPQGKTYDSNWQLVDYETPRALTVDEIVQLKHTYAQAAQYAKDAGFDGVELHASNGYILDQFLHDGVNQRQDQYGGSIENRCRLVLEVLQAVISVWGSGRVGIRLTPFGTFNDMKDSATAELFSYLIQQLNQLQLAYLHLVEPRASNSNNNNLPDITALFRHLYQGSIILAGGFERESAINAVEQGHAEAIAFGRYFISNPDLPKRLEINAPLNPYNRATFYGGGSQGYTDYPTL